jgi:hypothetical protein
MEFLQDTQGHDDVVDAYKTYKTSDVTALICFANKSKRQDLKLVTISCENGDGAYLGAIVVVGDEILRPGHQRTVEIESWQWPIARFQFHAMVRDGDAAWQPAHSDMFTGLAREIAVNYLGAFAAAESIAQPRFQWDRDYWNSPYSSPDRA